MKTTKILALFTSTFVAVGCSTHTHLLNATPDSTLIKGGKFTHEGKTSLTLSSAAKDYEAKEFPVRSGMKWEELRKQYQFSSPKHWDRIKSGLNRDHLIYSAEPVARSADGDELRCQLLWLSGQSPRGTCTDKAGKDHLIEFDSGSL